MIDGVEIEGLIPGGCTGLLLILADAFGILLMNKMRIRVERAAVFCMFKG